VTTHLQGRVRIALRRRRAGLRAHRRQLQVAQLAGAGALAVGRNAQPPHTDPHRLHRLIEPWVVHPAAGGRGELNSVLKVSDVAMPSRRTLARTASTASSSRGCCTLEQVKEKCQLSFRHHSESVVVRQES